MPPRRGRPPASVRKLLPETIVAAGLETVQEFGLDGFTMSRVAERIGVRAASLYWHVQHKEELLDLLAEDFALSLDLARFVQPGDWRGSLAEIARAMRAGMLSRRDSARLLMGRFSTGPGQLRNIETILGVLREAGFGDRDCSYALFLLVTFLSGFVGGEQAPLSARVVAGQPSRQYLDELGGRLAELPAEQFPHTTALAAELTAPDLTSRFEFALKCLLDGIAGLPRG